MAEVFPEDGAVYECVATNNSGTSTSSCSLLVLVPDEKPFGPVIVSFPRSQNADEGSSVKFTCTIESSPKTAVTWSRSGREIEDGGRFKFSEDGDNYSFEIPAVLSTDSGTYLVTAVDESGKSTGAFSLHVARGESVRGVDVQQLLNSVA